MFRTVLYEANQTKKTLICVGEYPTSFNKHLPLRRIRVLGFANAIRRSVTERRWTKPLRGGFCSSPRLCSLTIE